MGFLVEFKRCVDKFRHFSLVSRASQQSKASVFDDLEIWPNNDYIKIYEITSRTDLKERNTSAACAKFIQCTFLAAVMLTDTASFRYHHSDPEHCWSDVIISRNESGMTVMIITPLSFVLWYVLPDRRPTSRLWQWWVSWFSHSNINQCNHTYNTYQQIHNPLPHTLRVIVNF